MVWPPYKPDHKFAVNNAAISLTSEEEIARLLSTRGLSHHLDDLNPDDPNHDDENLEDVDHYNFLSEVIQRVTSKLMEYLAPRYIAEDIYEVPRIRELATYMAVHDITRRRGNEPIFEDEYAEVVETLERYREGTLYLDASSNGPRATMQSYVTDMRYSRNPVRVISNSSTNDISAQHLAYQYPFSWL